MSKKKFIIIILIVLIVVLWINGIIPRQIAKISATFYLKSNFPKKQYEYIDVEWSSHFGAYVIYFQDEKNEKVGFLMHYKYFPAFPGQGTNYIEEIYRIEY